MKFRLRSGEGIEADDNNSFAQQILNNLQQRASSEDGGHHHGEPDPRNPISLMKSQLEDGGTVTFIKVSKDNGVFNSISVLLSSLGNVFLAMVDINGDRKIVKVPKKQGMQGLDETYSDFS